MFIKTKYVEATECNDDHIIVSYTNCGKDNQTIQVEWDDRYHVETNHKLAAKQLIDKVYKGSARTWIHASTNEGYIFVPDYDNNHLDI